MKKSKHFRKDVIMARVIAGVILLVLIVLLVFGISLLTKTSDEDKNSQNSQNTENTQEWNESVITQNEFLTKYGSSMIDNGVKLSELLKRTELTYDDIKEIAIKGYELVNKLNNKSTLVNDYFDNKKTS